MQPTPQQASSRIAEIAGTLGAVIVIGGALVAAIVIASASGAAGAAAASALLVKYGLEFHRRSSQLEVDIENMCSDEVIQVKDVPDMTFKECVEYVINVTSNPDEKIYNETFLRVTSDLPKEMSLPKTTSFVHDWSILLFPTHLLTPSLIRCSLLQGCCGPICDDTCAPVIPAPAMIVCCFHIR